MSVRAEKRRGEAHQNDVAVAAPDLRRVPRGVVRVHGPRARVLHACMYVWYQTRRGEGNVKGDENTHGGRISTVCSMQEAGQVAKGRGEGRETGNRSRQTDEPTLVRA